MMQAEHEQPAPGCGQGINYRQHFPALRNADDPAIDRILAKAKTVSVPAGTSIFNPGSPCQHYLLVIEGSVRVQLVAENGREVVLYRVRNGESCILTTSCLLSAEHYPAEGIAETEVKALALPQSAFNEGLDQSPAFRRFVFANLGQRFAAVVTRMEEVAFHSIDSRLADALLKRSDQHAHAAITHQALALELGTAREVISRHLKRFEAQGWVQLSRGTITLIDTDALAKTRNNSAV